MSTQGSVEGCQISVHCRAGEVGETERERGRGGGRVVGGGLFAYRQVGGLGT